MAKRLNKGKLSRYADSRSIPEPEVPVELCRKLAYAFESAHGWCIGEYAQAVASARPESCAGVLPINTGRCICVGSPAFNFAVGLGIGKAVTTAELDEVEDFFRSRELPPRIDITPYTDPGFLRMLTARGYGTSEFTSILCFDLKKELPSAPDPEGTEVKWADATHCEAWVNVIVKCFFVTDPGPDRRAMMGTLFRTSSLMRVAAVCHGEVVGVASEMLPNNPDIAVIFGSAVLPEYRRRGIHSAMLRLRLERARDSGCRMVAVSATPGSASERNLIRCGFAPCYEKITYAGK